ncbi:YscO family type III secretion system apparatus protein [Endozoicomonas sp. 4G]|uniref:type III secretion system stalk subunit SctO n=1 Tax=Endozoicomonas sp. 4G TaxID=2872754 RepID=UPI0020789F87|nr:YscO family type III secretion system apparatus protein [Endozoicomonas sp. 4G]
MMHELLKVKQIREKSARDEVRKCEYRLEQAQLEVKNKEQELEEYIDWRCKEEQRLYDNIINTEIKQNELDQLKASVARMREKDVLLEQAINEARQNVEKARAQLEQARDDHIKAMQAVEKFEAFTKAQDEEAAKEAARLEDLEMEEFTVRPKF